MKTTSAGTFLLLLLCCLTMVEADSWTHLFSDLQRSLAQRLRLLVLPSLPIQNGQVIESGCDLTGI